jgi:hypothetical protein
VATHAIVSCALFPQIVGEPCGEKTVGMGLY